MNDNRLRHKLPVCAFLSLFAALLAFLAFPYLMPLSDDDGVADEASANARAMQYRAVETNPAKTQCEFDKEEINKHIYKMERDGARGAVTIHVVDEEGNPISAAHVRLGFTQPDQNRRSGIVEGKTDDLGFYGAERTSNWSCSWTVSKEGFHTSRGTVLFTHRGSRKAFLDGRWTDEPIGVEVELKKVSGAQFTHGVRYDDIVFFPTNLWVGFDFKACDLVDPYGSGKLTHILFRSDLNGVPLFCKGAMLGYTNVLHVKVVDGGLSVETEIGESESPFVSHLPPAFETNQLKFVYARTKGRILEDSRPPKKHYIVFCTDMSNKGGEGAFCGIIRNIEFSPGQLRLEYFFNQNPDDRRLDADVSAPLNIGK